MKLRLSFILLLLTSIALVAEAQPQRKRHKTPMDAAKEFLRYEEYNEALPHLQEMIASDPGNVQYNYLMGKALYGLYKKKDALRYLEIVNRTNPEIDPDFRLLYARCLHSNAQYQSAINQFRFALENHAPESKAYKQIDNTIRQCEYALRLDKSSEGEQFEVLNLGNSINSAYAEHSPVISPDGKLLLFTGRRPKGKGSKITDPDLLDEDIYYSQAEGAAWSEAKRAGKPLNTKGHDATISFSGDGKTMYFYRHNRNGGIFKTSFDPNTLEWGKPEAMGKPLNSKHYESCISASADGNLLFFTSDRPGGMGGLDIYMVRKQGEDEWGEPENLGANVNSSFDEDAPFLHPDGQSLYFSSNGPESIGGFDVFVSEYDSSAGQWGKASNLGKTINSPEDEIYFSMSGDGMKGIYTSSRAGGLGEKDLYEIQFPTNELPPDYPPIEVAGTVQDEESNDDVPALVTLVDDETGVPVDSFIVSSNEPEYSFEVEPERSYTLRVSSDGYDESVERIETPAPTANEVSLRKDLSIKRNNARNSGIALQNIYFDFNNSKLRASALDDLDRVVAYLHNNPGVQVQITGNADYYGTYSYNDNLATKRAKTAAAYLRKQGIEKDRVEIVSFSENRPLENNGNAKGRQYNRRCEFRFFRSGGSLVGESVKLLPGNPEPEIDYSPPQTMPGFDQPEEAVGASSLQLSADSEGQITDTDSDNGAMTGLTNDTDSRILPPASLDNEDIEGPATSSALQISNIYFGFDSYKINNTASQELDKIAQLLKSNPDYEIVIKGHTDALGSVKYNSDLSENRCLMALVHLEDAGISGRRMKIEGFSELQPLKSNDTELGRKYNRRVEFIVKKGNQVIVTSRP